MMKQRVVSKEHSDYPLTRVTQRDLCIAIETAFKSMVKKWNARTKTEAALQEKKRAETLKKRKRAVSNHHHQGMMYSRSCLYTEGKIPRGDNRDDGGSINPGASEP